VVPASTTSAGLCIGRPKGFSVLAARDREALFHVVRMRARRVVWRDLTFNLRQTVLLLVAIIPLWVGVAVALDVLVSPPLGAVWLVSVLGAGIIWVLRDAKRITEWLHRRAFGAEQYQYRSPVARPAIDEEAVMRRDLRASLLTAKLPAWCPAFIPRHNPIGTYHLPDTSSRRDERPDECNTAETAWRLYHPADVRIARRLWVYVANPRLVLVSIAQGRVGQGFTQTNPEGYTAFLLTRYSAPTLAAALVAGPAMRLHALIPVVVEHSADMPDDLREFQVIAAQGLDVATAAGALSGILNGTGSGYRGVRDHRGNVFGLPRQVLRFAAWAIALTLMLYSTVHTTLQGATTARVLFGIVAGALCLAAVMYAFRRLPVRTFAAGLLAFAFVAMLINIRARPIDFWSWGAPLILGHWSSLLLRTKPAVFAGEVVQDWSPDLPRLAWWMELVLISLCLIAVAVALAR
jgi:hypothetical protein